MTLRYRSEFGLRAAIFRLLCLITVGSSAFLFTQGQDQPWPQFRGPGALPVSQNPNLPSEWSRTKNVEWATKVPGVGWSSPIVSKGKIFLTSATSSEPMKQPSLGIDFSNDYVKDLMDQGKSEEEVMALVTERDAEMPDEIELAYNLFCIDLETGKILWKREFHSGRPPVGRHRKNSYTSETPVTDGEAIYVYVSFLGLYAFDFDGKQLWNTPLEAHRVYLDFGGGASPALHEGKLFISSDNEDGSFTAAFDKNTGKQLWRTAREGFGSKQMRSGWVTPFIWENEKRTEVVTLGPGKVISYDLHGTELWRMGRMGNSTIPSPFAWDGLLYVTSGYPSEKNKPTAAIRPGGQGDITPPEDKDEGEYVAWYNRLAGGSYLPTPVIYRGGLYVITAKGIFTRYDAKTGESTYKSRIHPTALNFTSSPWAYNDKIFCINEEGRTFVIKAGEEFELLAMNTLEGFTLATPAIVGDRLLIRTQATLYSIRDQSRRRE